MPQLTQPNGTLPLTYGQFVLTLVPIAPLRLAAYSGSMFRGAFGIALQQVVCVTRTYDCPPCLLKDRCLFPYVFETPPPADSRVMRKYPSAPHPFLLKPPGLGEREVPAGVPLEVGLTLFGRSLQSLPYFIVAFERLGHRGLGKGRVQCQLERVDAVHNGRPWLLYAADERVLHPPDPFETTSALPLAPPSPMNSGGSRDVTIEFVTPARLRYETRLARELPFHVLIRNLLRRLGHVSYFHCGGDPSQVAFRDWIARAEAVQVASSSLAWYDWERYSGRQQTRMKLGGLVGRITYRGPVAPFWGLLQVGEITHVGKGTSFGLGRYRILP